ncbi:hypothetical protein SAMN04489740_3842 [Arthrobacter alpinus]|uniref:TNase-like domain-containing protein n=1 Tax=Arthrobacter alpinus TaxID=656366 RepID=A0A1H5NM44_9MICC|nr:hypothetical protein [Arthrobacter alpinus]SEF02666.1 hypothetical protein SAMN04489740_3842 [Arthrobacter alpinus]
MSMPRYSMRLVPLTLLAGCAPTESSQVNQDAPSQSATATATPTPILNEKEALAKAMKGQMGATVLEVLDPGTFLVELSPYEQKMKGLSGEATVTFRKSLGLVTPAQGECGYDEAFAFAKQYFADNPDDVYVSEGSFGTDHYLDEALRAGFAYIPDHEGRYDNALAQAAADRAGLYALCPNFGA